MQSPPGSAPVFQALEEEAPTTATDEGRKDIDLVSLARITNRESLQNEKVSTCYLLEHSHKCRSMLQQSVGDQRGFFETSGFFDRLKPEPKITVPQEPVFELPVEGVSTTELARDRLPPLSPSLSSLTERGPGERHKGSRQRVDVKESGV